MPVPTVNSGGVRPPPKLGSAGPIDARRALCIVADVVDLFGRMVGSSLRPRTADIVTQCAMRLGLSATRFAVSFALKSWPATAMIFPVENLK